MQGYQEELGLKPSLLGLPEKKYIDGQDVVTAYESSMPVAGPVGLGWSHPGGPWDSGTGERTKAMLQPTHSGPADSKRIHRHTSSSGR